MPRVHRATKLARGKPVHCRICGKPVEPGQEYFKWSKRVGGTSFIHVEHGFPKPSMLSSRKTAVIEDMIPSSQAAIEAWEPEVSEQVDFSDVASVLQDVANVANEVADEYEASADNLPENLQYGTQAEAMRDVAERLRDWATEMEDWTPDEGEPDVPEFEEFEDQDAFDEAVSLAWSDWADGVKAEATSKLDDMPEYEG